MTLPGENTLTLTNAAIMRLVQERLNADLATGAAFIRVTAARNTGYSGMEFMLTSDPLPSSDTTTTKATHE